MTGCLFCRIASGEIAAHIVDDDPKAIVFLDRRPLFVGHCLVVPKAHHETLADLPKDQVGSFFQLVQRIARPSSKGSALTAPSSL